MGSLQRQVAFFADQFGDSDFEKTININEAFDTSVAVGAHAFAKMEGDLDKQRLNKIQGRIVIDPDTSRAEIQKRYVHFSML